MKVIVAGYSKTGTKSLKSALVELGYKVYDFPEHFLYHNDKWLDIMKGKGSIDYFKTMYEDVDAIVDIPAVLYWYEIHKAFPDAKIILTIRDEDSWFKSVQKQNEVFNHNTARSFAYFAFRYIPFVLKIRSLLSSCLSEISGVPVEVGILRTNFPVNEMRARQKYRNHNAGVLQVAPKDKLLVYKIKDGWETLCPFLEKDIPQIPFPHKNVAGKGIQMEIFDHKVGRQIRRDMVLFILVVLLLFAFMFYFLREYPVWMPITTSFCVLAGFQMLF